MATVHELSGPDDLDDNQREAVETLLYRLADDEFVAAERYTEWQVRSPTLESDLALSNIAQDELGHARLWYDLLEDFGATEADLVWEREPGEWRHSTLVERPFAEGDWADAIVRTYLYDTAEMIRLESLADSTYPRIADRVAKIMGEEDYHREHARSWLERLCEDDEGHTRVQDALTRLFSHALTLFAPTDASLEARIDELGLRSMDLVSMRAAWLKEVVPYLESLDLSFAGVVVPNPYDVDHDEVQFPDARGRDRTHTNDWPALWEDFTEAYRDLGRDRADRIMGDPDDE